LVERIRRSISLDWDVVVKHSYKESNQCVDALANFGSSLNEDIVYYLLLAYVIGILIPRLISV